MITHKILLYEYMSGPWEPGACVYIGVSAMASKRKPQMQVIFSQM